MKHIILMCCFTLFAGCSCSYKSILISDTESTSKDTLPDTETETAPLTSDDLSTGDVSSASFDSQTGDTESDSLQPPETDDDTGDTLIPVETEPAAESEDTPTSSGTDTQDIETDTGAISTDTETIPADTGTAPIETDSHTQFEETDTPSEPIDTGDTADSATVEDTESTPKDTEDACLELSISPDDLAAMFIGQSNEYQALCKMPTGEIVDVTANAIWESSNRDSVAVVSVEDTCTVEVREWSDQVVTLSATLQRADTALIDTVDFLTYAAPQRDIEIECAIACNNFNNGFMVPGTTAALTAVGYHDDGSPRYPERCRWHSFDENVVKAIDGFMFPSLPGDTTFEVACDDGSYTIKDIFVSNFDYIVVSLWPAAVTLPVGLPFQFEAALYINYYPGIGTALWKSRNTDIVTISPDEGIAVGRQPGGPVTITASSLFNTEDTAAIIVEELAFEKLSIETVHPNILFSMHPGSTQTFVAWAHYEGGYIYDVTRFSDWHVTDPVVANFKDIYNRGADLVAAASGSTTVFAVFEGYTSSDITVTVANKTVTEIEVSTRSGDKTVSIPYSASVPFVATAIYDDGTTGDMTKEVNWELADPTVATHHLPSTVSNSQAGFGVTTITATHEPSGKSDSATIETILEIVETIEVSPSKTTIPKGTSTLFEIVANYHPSGRRWSQSEDGLFFAGRHSGSIYNGHQKGRLQSHVSAPTGNKTCDVEISAEMGGLLSDNACVTINDVLVERLELQTSTHTLAPMGTTQLSCVAQFDDGSQTDVTLDATWSASTPEAGWVSNVYGQQGVLTAAPVGVATDISITCRFSGLSASATLTITP